MDMTPVSSERLRNTLAWATARIGTLSGADVIAEAITELLQLRARETTWIPVTERLPDDGTHVLVTVTGMFGDVAMDAYFLKGAWLRGEEYLTDVSAWQPLPAPYKVTP